MMMLFWQDSGTLTDTQLIVEEQKITVLYQFCVLKIINEP